MLPTPTADNWALITGASQGIGEAIARELGRRGYNLILVARRGDVLETIAAEITANATQPVQVRVEPCDLADRDQRSTLIEKLRDENIAIIVNSAGIASFGKFIDQDWDYEQTQFRLNAEAVFDLTRAVLPGMLARGSGAICNVGSAAGNKPIPNNATYVFTKAGVNTFTEALHYELKGTGVACTLLAPGPVREAIKPEDERTIVDKVVPDFLWTTYESCATDTLAALARNQRRVVPGPLSKAMNFISEFAPTAALSPLLGWVYSKMAE
ncbi:MAG: mycolate reductase [Corynebacterium sp.]|nr:mycolate reductase [Corynebacterium sp.]